jgi:uncharacterized membrane protein YwaF
MLAAGVVLALLMVITRRDWIYPLVIAWAFAGIAVRFPDVTLVFWPAVIGTVAALAASVYALYNRVVHRRRPVPV